MYHFTLLSTEIQIASEFAFDIVSVELDQNVELFMPMGFLIDSSLINWLREGIKKLWPLAEVRGKKQIQELDLLLFIIMLIR